MTAVRLLVLAAELGLLAGCSSSNPGKDAPPEYGVLQEVNELLRAAAGAGKRPPARLADLDRYQATFPRAYEAVKSGNVVVLWGAGQKGESEAGKDESVLAYEKTVPTEGGYVLLSAGTVKKMTAAEFNAAPKAGKK
jgi:hypothetical protein